MRGCAGGERFRRSIKQSHKPEWPRSNRVGAFEELLMLIYWRLFEWFSLILYVVLMFYCCDLWNSARVNKHPGTGTFAECDVIIERCRPRDQAHQLPHGVLYCISKNAGPGLRGASRVPEVCYFSVLTVDRNYLQVQKRTIWEGLSLIRLKVRQHFFILFVPESHFVSEESVSQIKDPEFSDRKSRIALLVARGETPLDIKKGHHC